MRKDKDAIKLFLKQEGKELRGKKNFNIWILFALFLTAILSVGFGSAGLSYLKYKMDDPFIDWVEIYVNQNVANPSDVIPLNEFVKDAEYQKKYHFEEPEEQYELFLNFCHKTTNRPIQLGGRNIQSNSEITTKIFDEENVISINQLPFSDNNLAIIITQDALKRLGYSLSDKPDFVMMSFKYDIPTCRSIGLSCGKRGECQVAFPIYAIVKQLPGMYAYMFSDQFLYDIYVSNETAWDITDDNINSTLTYVAEKEEIDALQKEINGMGLTSENPIPYSQSISSSLLMLPINIDDENCSAKANEIDKIIRAKHKNIVRVYDFPMVLPSQCSLGTPEKISVHIEDLQYIRSFQESLYDECGYKIDMTNVDAKENFNFVQRMGNVLSVCIIIIASLLICFFIYFMLSSHFQRIQKNLGTFKAFGISNRVLTSIYMRLMIRMIVISFASALIVSFGLSKLFDLVYPPLEEGYPWIDVFVLPNIILFVLVMVATYISTKIVNRKLNNTPGDLIYNRIK